MSADPAIWHAIPASIRPTEKPTSLAFLLENGHPELYKHFDDFVCLAISLAISHAQMRVFSRSFVCRSGAPLVCAAEIVESNVKQQMPQRLTGKMVEQIPISQSCGDLHFDESIIPRDCFERDGVCKMQCAPGYEYAEGNYELTCNGVEWYYFPPPPPPFSLPSLFVLMLALSPSVCFVFCVLCLFCFCFRT